MAEGVRRRKEMGIRCEEGGKKEKKTFPLLKDYKTSLQ